MWLILFALLLHLMSGWKNGLYYYNNHSMSISVSFMMIILMVVGLYVFDASNLVWVLHTIPALAILYVVWAVFRVRKIEKYGTLAEAQEMKERKNENLHSGEHAIKDTWYVIMLLCGMNVFELAVIIFAGNFLFNIPVSIYTNRPVFEGDDYPFEDVRFRIFGKKYRIDLPRVNSGYRRLLLAIVFIGLCLLNTYWLKLNWSLNLNF